MGKAALAQATCVVVVAALVAACSRTPAPVPPTQSQAPRQVYDPGQPVGSSAGPDAGAPVLPVSAETQAAAFFPATDTRLTYELRDQGAADSMNVQEVLLRDGDRAVAVANRQAYAVWEIRPDGVWRADPRNPGTPLRYLPPRLSDGLFWRQRSGDADVWFRLSVAAQCSQQAPSCWEVVVLNRGDRTAFRFAGANGPISAVADDWAQPVRSFQKFLYPEVAPAQLSAAERDQFLKELGSAPAPAPVTAATEAQFEEAVFTALQSAQPTLQTVRLDLNGDGRADVMQGRLDQWTTSALHFYQSDGSPAGYGVAGATGRFRATRLAFPTMRLPAFLIEQLDDRGFGGVAILTARANPYNQTWSVEPVYGWAQKASGVIADRVSWTADGTITVEWDMLDPARHTRVTTYTWVEDRQQGWAGVQRQSITYRPQADQLRYPATPGELLEAAFVARWFGLTEELPRYFASREEAAAIAADQRVSQPDYGPGSVAIGKVTPRDRTEGCGPLVSEVEPQGPGPHAFAATWGGYEWCASAWGSVTFGVDPQGRPVISDLILEGQASQGE